MPPTRRPRPDRRLGVLGRRFKAALGVRRLSGSFVAPADIEVSGPAEEPRLIAWSTGGERKVPTRLVDLQLGPDYMGCVGVLSHRTPLARLIEGDELLAAAAVPLRTTTG